MGNEQEASEKPEPEDSQGEQNPKGQTEKPDPRKMILQSMADIAGAATRSTLKAARKMDKGAGIVAR